VREACDPHSAERKKLGRINGLTNGKWRTRPKPPKADRMKEPGTMTNDK